MFNSVMDGINLCTVEYFRLVSFSVLKSNTVKDFAIVVALNFDVVREHKDTSLREITRSALKNAPHEENGQEILHVGESDLAIGACRALYGSERD